MNTHGPYRVPGPAKTALLGRRPTREFRYNGLPMADIVKGRRLAARSEVTQAYVESLVEQYDTAIRHTTDQLGRVVDALREAGVYDRSLIVVTADHGEELFDRGGFSHGYSLHREVVRIPLYVKLPGQRREASSHVRVSLVDLVPTVRDLLGFPPADTDGLSLRSVLEGAAPRDPWPQRPLVHEVDWPDRCIARSIVVGSTKLIELERNYEGRRDEALLFDVARDPQERVNLAAAQPAVVEQLRARLADVMARANATAVGGHLRVRAVDAERLRALGYL
jgi:arylsulfatase A-like enzyme